MTALCAVCEEKVLPDVDHIEIDAERWRMDDPNETEQYWMHTDCAAETIDQWLSLSDQA